MSVKTDLIEARKLIATPAQWLDLGCGIVTAISLAQSDPKPRAEAINAIRATGLIGGEPHHVVLAGFDRAIEAAE